MNNLVGYFKTHQKTAIPLAIAVLVGLSGIGYTVYQYTHPTKKVVQRNTSHTATKKPAPPKPTTKASPLTGLAVAPELADRPITGVVIENHTDARPQSGLSQAGVVYEALAEGGITRFLAFFLESRPAIIGPVRSLRTYFVDWGLEFNSPVAHAGGNADALDLVRPLGLKDMDGLIIGPPTFYRVNDRYAPHNLYTTSDLLDAQEAKYNYNKPSDFIPSPRKADSPPASGTPASHPNISINYSYNGYQVSYQYDPATNDYARFLAGSPHIDRNTGAQIHVKNIVVEYMPTSYGTTRIGEQTVIMGTPGSGQAIVFRDGTAIVGSWSKTAHNARTQLVDANGANIPLNAGNTWYSIVPNDRTVSY